jgi:hypothetical protein
VQVKQGGSLDFVAGRMVARDFLPFAAIIPQIGLREAFCRLAPADWRLQFLRGILMMTDPDTTIKREVFQLIELQIETLRREGHLSDSALVE